MKKVNVVLPLGIAISLYFFTRSEDASAATEATVQREGPAPGDAVAYIKKYFPFAQTTQELYGVPALVTIAQAGIEGAWGKSNVAVKSNNQFGIKADKRWKGPKFGAYRKYDSVQDSYNDHAKFLSTNKRYNKAFLTREPKKFLQEVANANYSENPDYALIVGKVMDLAQRVI